MTIRELRQKLFEIEDQQMTVEELRHILFEVEDQDAELEPDDLWRITRR